MHLVVFILRVICASEIFNSSQMGHALSFQKLISVKLLQLSKKGKYCAVKIDKSIFYSENGPHIQGNP